jgi:two-component system response regulator WspF
MRIAIVNEAARVVEALRRAVLSTAEHSVPWVAFDGASAVRFSAEAKPDLILMGLLEPGLDGVEAARQIMARTPCPIVMVTADPAQNHARVFEALGAGALDALNLPELLGPETSAAPPALLAKIDVIRRLTRETPSPALRSPPMVPHPPSPRRPTLVAFGASAGGPGALAAILRAWPPDLPAALVAVQHLDSQFTPSLAAWLASQTHLQVRAAREADPPEAGTVLLAGAKGHLTFGPSARLGYSPHPREAPFMPSVDVFFLSILEHWPGEVIAVLLTGMGRDGAAGLKLLRDAGHYTIAQDETSSAVYGMPKAAAELGAAREILPLAHIAPRIALRLARPPRF